MPQFQTRNLSSLAVVYGTPSAMLACKILMVRRHAFNSRVYDNVQQVALDEDKEWADLERTLPSNGDLLASARNHRAPQQWYDEQIDPR